MKLNKGARIKLYFILLLFLASFQLAGQTLSLRVVDAETSRPLPFVSVLFDGQSLGTSTNIDGFFSLTRQAADTIWLSYIGYSKQQLALTDLHDGDQIRMSPSLVQLGEVEVFPGENPADVILAKVVANREKHRPENLDSYHYQSYNKLTFSLDDTSRRQFAASLKEKPDSANSVLKRLLEQQDLFLMESVSNKIYQKPQKEKEVVIASRVSGLEDPSFFLLATQLQSFTFYQDYVRLFEKQFLSPVSPNSWNRYLFILEETLHTPAGDSLFVIRFQPRKSKNFQALKGILKISSDGYAIESLRVSAADPSNDRIQLSVEQSYDKLPSGDWFPKALNSEISLKGLNLPGSGFPANSVNLKAFGKTYLSNRQVNLSIDRQQFQGAQLSVNPSATHPEIPWDTLRSVSLSANDSLVYQLIDSLGQQNRFDAKMFLVESLADYRLPVGKMDLVLDRMIGLNKFEGVQLGLALETNPKFSRWLSLGGYWRYGLKDKKDKYGGDVQFKIHQKSNTSLFFHYENDVREDGAISFLEQKEPFISRQLDSWYRTNFTYHEMWQAGVAGRPFPSLLTKAYWKDYRLKTPTFIVDGQEIQPVDYQLVGVQFHLAFKERLFRRRGEIYSLGSDLPVLHFNYERALANRSDRPYEAVEFKLSDSYRIRNLGETEMVILGAFRESGGVANLLASPPSSRPRLFSFYNKASFATMRINEFANDEMLALFFRHNFGSLLFRYKQIRPDILLVFNAGVGSSAYDQQTDFVRPYPSISKGYYEGGVLVAKLLRVGLFKLGAGAFYRFGPYQLDSFQDNLALKFTLDLAI